MSDTAVIVGALGAIAGGFFTYLVAYLNKDKTQAEAAQTLMHAALEVTERLGSLARQADERETVLNDTREELRKVQDERDDTLKRLTSLETNDKQKAAQIIALQEEIERLDRLGKDKDREISKQAGELEDLRKKLATAQIAQEADRATIAGLYLTIESQNATITKLGSDLESAEKDRRRLESEMAQFKGEKDDTVEIAPEIIQAARESQNINPALVLTAPESALKSDGGNPL